jgi:hypothetical protein
MSLLSTVGYLMIAAGYFGAAYVFHRRAGRMQAA